MTLFLFDFFVRSFIVFGTCVPSTAIAWLMPHFIRLSTSALPSTMIISSLLVSPGPAGRLSGPNFVMPAFLPFVTAVVISPLPGAISSSQPFKMLIALLTTFRRFAPRMSSTFSRVTLAVHGPTLSTVSTDAARIAVAVLFSETGITISPLLFPPSDLITIWILPIRPVRCSSRRSKSSPKRPSVCPNIAPTTSGLSTTPSTSIFALMTYFAVL